MQKTKGFTIIELLVVVAIIAVLAAIVMVNVTSYIAKGRDAAARGNLGTLLINSAVYFDDVAKGNGTYGYDSTHSFKLDPSYTSVASALLTAGYTITSACNGTAACTTGTNSLWCASVPLKQFTTTKYFCVDSSGKKSESTTAICAAGACPD